MVLKSKELSTNDDILILRTFLVYELMLVDKESLHLVTLNISLVFLAMKFLQGIEKWAIISTSKFQCIGHKTSNICNKKLVCYRFF